MRVYILSALLVATVAGLPKQRIIGGTETDISSFPFVAVLLRYNANTGSYEQQCGGAIINNRSILTSVNCFINDTPQLWRARVGSSLANSGGEVHMAGAFITHPQYNFLNSDNDVAILRTQSFINNGANVNRVSIAGPGYILNDNTAVTLLGWGAVGWEQEKSNQLLRADIRTINQDTCRNNYNIISMEVTDNMMCAGNPSGGADFCEGDVGDPLVHNNVLIGIASWRNPICGLPNYPGVYTSVNRYSSWIQANA